MANFLYGSRLTCAGRLGLRGIGAGGGKGLRRGTTSSSLLCLDWALRGVSIRGPFCCRTGAPAADMGGIRDSLGPSGLWWRSIMFCRSSPVCLILLLSTGGLSPGERDGALAGDGRLGDSL